MFGQVPPVRAQVVPDNGLPMLDAAAHDLASGGALINRQVATAIGATGLGMGIGRAQRLPEDNAWRPLSLPDGLGTVIRPRAGICSSSRHNRWTVSLCAKRTVARQTAGGCAAKSAPR